MVKLLARILAYNWHHYAASVMVFIAWRMAARGAGLKGEDIAKDLHSRGYTTLSMATGHNPEKFFDLTWLKVAGKEPPWPAK